MAIQFPTSPSNGQTYTYNGITYVYNTADTRWTGQFTAVNFDSLDSEAIADGAIHTTQIAANAVTTAKINGDAVTSAKIADDAVGVEHLNTSSAGSTDQILTRTASGMNWADASSGGGAPSIVTQTQTISAQSTRTFTGTSSGATNWIVANWAHSGGDGDRVWINSGGSGTGSSASTVMRTSDNSSVSVTVTWAFFS